MTLSSLQNAFGQYLFTGDPSAITPFVASTAPVSVDTRLSIYSNAYLSRIHDVLLQDYPALYALMGEDNFVTLVHHYLSAYPSIYPSIRWIGKHMPTCLANYLPYCDNPELAELAQFEWYLSESFDEKDDDPLTLAQLSQLPPENWGEFRLIPTASLRFMATNYNILDIWQAAAKKETLPISQQLIAPASILIWRKQMEVQFQLLSPVENIGICAMLQDKNFSEICEALRAIENEDNIALSAATFIKTAVISQWLKC